MPPKTITRLVIALAIFVAGPAMRAAAPAGNSQDIDVAAFSARFGLSARWLEPEKRLALQGAAARFEFEADQREAIFDGRKIYLGVPPVTRQRSLWISEIDAEKLLAPLLRLGRDRPPPVRTIVIDPGHGGADHGTENKRLGLMEKTYTLDTAFRLQKLLQARGYKVLLTRTDDVYVPLALRPEVARRIGADLFISIHFNADLAASVHGTETFRFSPRYQPPISRIIHRAGDDESNPNDKYGFWDTLLAYHIQQSLLGRLGWADRGVRHDKYAVLRLAPCPAVLIESGYLSNDAEGRKIATPACRQQIAEAIAAGIDAYARLGAPAAPKQPTAPATASPSTAPSPAAPPLGAPPTRPLPVAPSPGVPAKK